MTAPTTRETADHAELARLAEAAIESGVCGRPPLTSVELSAFIAAANPATVLALLSEIAALHGERDDLKRHRDRLAITCQRRLDDWRSAQAQATQAERQRDELREALVQADLTIRSMPVMDQSDVEFIHQALANQGAE